MRLRIVDAVDEAMKGTRRKQEVSPMEDLFELHPDLVAAQGPGPTIYPADEILTDAFTHFRKNGFPYRKLPVHICKQEINALAKCQSLLTTTLGYHVADTYHPHRFHGHARKMKSPVEAFDDDKLLMRAIKLQYETTGVIGSEHFQLLNMVSGTQACSNFRPGVAVHYYRKFCKNGSLVLDPCTGYGGRLLGFIASGCAGKYYGIDPSAKTSDGNSRMATDLGVRDKVRLYKCPAEDFNFLVLSEKMDFCFTSPPYFVKEEYAEESTQSFKRYPEPDAWRKGFLRPFMRLQFEALKPGHYSAVNIANVKIGSKIVPLEKWVVEAAERVGFEHRDTENLVLSSHRFGSGDYDGTGDTVREPVFIFRKPK